MDSKRRAELRALASKQDAIFQVGKGGINDNMVKQLDDALNAREIIKLTVLETSPESAKDAAVKLAKLLNADVVQIIGYKIILYRENPEKKLKKQVSKEASTKNHRTDDAKKQRFYSNKTAYKTTDFNGKKSGYKKGISSMVKTGEKSRIKNDGKRSFTTKSKTSKFSRKSDRRNLDRYLY